MSYHPTMTVPCATCGKPFESDTRYDKFSGENEPVDSLCVPCFQAEYNAHLDSCATPSPSKVAA